MRWLKRHPVLLLLLLLGGSVGGLNYSGLCIAKGRWLSDAEQIASAVDHLNQPRYIRIDKNIPSLNKYEINNYNIVPYKDRDEFFVKNPQCCAVNPSGGYDMPAPNFWDRIQGIRSPDVVRVKYTAQYIDKVGDIQKTNRETDLAISNCGKIFQF